MTPPADVAAMAAERGVHIRIVHRLDGCYAKDLKMEEVQICRNGEPFRWIPKQGGRVWQRVRERLLTLPVRSER